MSATITGVTKIGSVAWKFAWTGTAPYTLVLRGKVIAEGLSDTSWTLQEGNSYRPPPLEVLDANDTDPAPSQVYPPWLALQWRGTSAAQYYRVDRRISGVWTAQPPLVQETGRGYYRWDTAAQDDDTAQIWRVVAVDRRGYESMVREVNWAVVRHPEPPNLSLSYDSGTNQITVSAA